MLPSSSELKYFVMLSETENMSRAAERLGISQPSLSLAVKRLEEYAGTELVVRSRTGVKLSRAGWRLAAGAKDLLESWEALKKQVGEEKTEVSGVYSFGCHSAVAGFFLPRVLKTILKKHSRLELRLEHDLSRNICEKVVSFKIDFAVVVNPVAHPDLVIKELYKDRVGFFGVPRAERKTLIYNPELVQSKELLKRALKANLKFERSVTSSSLEVIGGLAAEGIGVAVLPERVARQCSSKLKMISEHWPQYFDRHCFVYRGDFHRSAVTKAMAEAFSHIKE